LFSIVAFKIIAISQGSVATHPRCGGIFSYSIITNFLLILTVNTFENRLIFSKVKAYRNGANILGHHVCLLKISQSNKLIGTQASRQGLCSGGFMYNLSSSQLFSGEIQYPSFDRNIGIARAALATEYRTYLLIVSPTPNPSGNLIFPEISELRTLANTHRRGRRQCRERGALRMAGIMQVQHQG